MRPVLTHSVPRAWLRLQRRHTGFGFSVEEMKDGTVICKGSFVRRSFVGFFMMLLMGGWAAVAQAQTITLSGTVADTSGGALPGVVVTLVPEAVASPQVTTTDGTGRYEFRGLVSGTYRLQASLSGFQDLDRPVILPTTSGSFDVTMALAGFAEQVSVTAAREERVLAAIPVAVGVAGGDPVLDGRSVNIAEPLRHVPGVYAGDVSGVDDVRITIRGAGVRATFGSRGVILMTDGVPVTEPDGQTPHIDGQVDLASAQRVEVVKGPSSAIYGGAALGGVVNVITRPPVREPHGRGIAQGGSYQFGKGHAQLSGAVGDVLMSGAFGGTHLDGFREHNSLRNWAGNFRADWVPTPDDRFSFRVTGTDALLDLPGALNREQFDSDPMQSRPVFQINDWRRDNTVIRFGGRYDRAFGVRHHLEVDSYGQYRDLLHPIFVVIDQNARRYTGHARYRYAADTFTLASGLDLDTQGVEDRWFVNVLGNPTFQIRDDDNRVTNMGVYFQGEVPLDHWSVTAGVRYDRITYDLEDLLLFDGDSSDRRVFERVSPKIGVVGRFSDAVSVYGNFSTGFEAPTLGEIRLPAGFNGQVDPQKAVNVEGGLRGTYGLISYDIGVYRMQVTDEILPVTIDDVTLFFNVAETSHTGVELSVRARPTALVQLDGTYAYSRFILEEFDDLSGNRLPGIPTNQGTVGVSVGPFGAFDVSGNLTFASETFVNDANDEAANAYAVVSLLGRYRLGDASVFVRGDNLTDQNYTNRVQVNDSGGFYYFPSPGRNVSAGIEVGW